VAVYWITTSLWTLGQQLAFWRATRTARRSHPVSKKKKRKRRR